jgi:Glucosamine 6-phosphate synthetase, contains amidotransferase and phosphosugar isomerase domains
MNILQVWYCCIPKQKDTMKLLSRFFAALLGVLLLQLLACHMSIMRGYNPDFPKNLSKRLTVD